MKTLIAVTDSALKKTIFNTTVIEMLSSISEICWLEEGKTYTSSDLLHYIWDCDACITSWGSPKITEKVVHNAPKLKFIGHAAGTVVPYIDSVLFDNDLVVVNANSALSKSTAEGAMAFIMAGAWQIYQYNMMMKQSQWSDNNRETVLGLNKQVIGLIGYGDISRELIRLLKPFEARILMYSNYCPEEEAKVLGIELCNLDEVLRQSKIISLHNTLTPSTRGMIGEKEMIQDGALLVNTARAPIINEAALLNALKSKRFFAALDVFWEEPLKPDSNLLSLHNVLCTPHIAGFSSYWKSRLAQTVIEDMKRWMNGEKLEGQITKEKFSRLTPA